VRPLARLHGEIALTTLLSKLPGLRLAREPVQRGFVPLHELEHLPVAWTMSRRA
jgi:cytochrome P450